MHGSDELKPRPRAAGGWPNRVALIGFSRLYLGVHWTTDVLASWSLGAAWLSASMGAYLLWSRFWRPLPESRPWKSARARIVLTIVLAAGVLAVVVVAAGLDPLLAKAVSMG